MMSSDFRATPELWARAEEDADRWVDATAFHCLLELRARVEALEAAQQPATCPHIVSSDEGTSYCRLAEQGARVTIPDSQMLHALRDALCDAISALRYIEQHHGRLHGVGWDRVYKSADPLLNAQAEQSAAPAPTGSLVERVHSCIVGEPECGHMQARAAIREVAAWLSKESDGHLGSGAHWAGRLQREANQ